MIKRLTSVFGQKKRALAEACQKARSDMIRVVLDRGQPTATQCEVIGALYFTTGIIKTEIGTVTLGVTAGKFYFTPQNASIPPQSLATSLTPSLNVNQAVTVNASRNRGMENQDKQTAEQTDSARMKIAKDPEGGMERGNKRQREDLRKENQGSSETLNYSTNSGRLSASPYGCAGIQLDVAAGLGTDNKPAPLDGKYMDDRLFSLHRENHQAGQVAVTFQPLPGSIRALEGTGLWNKNLSPEKSKLMQRLVGMLVDQEAWTMGTFDLLEATEQQP